MKALRELEAGATPAPWVADDTSDWHSEDVGREVSTGWFRAGPGQIDVGDYNTLTYADAALIAAARNALPLLLDVVDAARAVVQQHDFTERRPLTGTEWQALRDKLAALDSEPLP